MKQEEIERILERRISTDCKDGFVEITICGIPEATADIMELWQRREEEVRRESIVDALMAIGDAEDESLYPEDYDSEQPTSSG